MKKYIIFAVFFSTFFLLCKKDPEPKPWLPIDIVTKGLTTWKFTSSNQFILDGGSTYSYNVNTNGIFNVYGLENGSARNIEVLLSTPDYINVKVALRLLIC